MGKEINRSKKWMEDLQEYMTIAKVKLRPSCISVLDLTVKHILLLLMKTGTVHIYS